MKTFLFGSVMFAVLVMLSSCETCFKCHVYDSVNDLIIYQEPLVTCDEGMDLHKSVLEKAYQCADCSFTTAGITTTETYCAEAEKIAEWIKLREDNPFLDYTCVKKNPTVNCYESD